MTTSTAPSKPWADTPLALIPTPVFVTKKHDLFTTGSSHMCMVHNSIFRGYNSIYHQALHITEADKADFIGYCLTWHKFLKTHANNEDTSLFPKTEELLDDKTIFEDSHNEHELFYPGLAKFHDYLVNLKFPSEFSGTKLLEIMATFQDPFEIHMRSEVAILANLSKHPRTPKEGSAEEKSVQAEIEAREGSKLVNSGITDVLPFFLFNFDRDYEDGLWMNWPPIPAPVRFIMMGIGRILHPGWWKFASCDTGRQRKELYAAPDLQTGT
ncbi:hypothetical protein B7463_g7428, partial [Scytalidium lignicola]